MHLLGFARLTCGCLVAPYHERTIDRNVEYVEERGCRCACSDHRRNQPLPQASRRSAGYREMRSSAASSRPSPDLVQT